MTDQTLDKTTLIVGAGHAGVQAAASLREYGWQGQIALINDEDRLPYERPPLSKTFEARSLSSRYGLKRSSMISALT